MQTRHAKTFRPIALAAAALALALPGCGSSTYDELMNYRLDQLRASAPFRVLYRPTRLADLPLKIRVPIAYRNSYTGESLHPDDGGEKGGGKISPDRLQPPFLPLPGMKICYEGSVVVSGTGKLPYYCYLAAIPAKPGDADKLADELRTKLKEKFKDAPEEWENVDARTPKDTALVWKKIRVVGAQSFHAGYKKTDVQDLPGIFELWLYDAENYIVLVGWRSPISIEGPADAPVQSDAPQILLNPNSIGAKPDFTAMPALTAGTLEIETPADGAAPAPAG